MDINQWRGKIPHAGELVLEGDVEAEESVIDAASASSKLRKRSNKQWTSTAHRIASGFGAGEQNIEGQDREAILPKHKVMTDLEMENIIGTLTREMMAKPDASLDPRFNSMVYRMLESFRYTANTILQLKQQLKTQSGLHQIAELDAQRRISLLMQEKQQNEEEIRRLQLALTKKWQNDDKFTAVMSRENVSPPKATRTSPEIDSKSTTAKSEMLPYKHKYQGSGARPWESVPSFVKPRPGSAEPSGKRKKFSDWLSVDSARAHDRRGTKGKGRKNYKISSPSPLISPLPSSESTFSAFTWERENSYGKAAHEGSNEKATLEEGDVSFMHLANLLAKNKGLNPMEISEQLRSKFMRKSPERQPRKVKLTTTDTSPEKAAKEKAPGPLTSHPVQKGLLPGEYPLVSFVLPESKPAAVPKHAFEARKFSFEPGDDAQFGSPPAGHDSFAAEMRARRRERELHGVTDDEAVSETMTGSVSELRRPTRIPTPRYGPVSLARPRQDREDSRTSLLTAILVSDADEGKSAVKEAP